jgi:8-oxo-dGTP pyrophosphatase MutT (NUDIX family)
MDEDHPQRQPARWPTVTQELRGRFRLFDLFETTRRSPTTGQEHRFMRLEAPDWVNVVAITRDGHLVLVEQYRHGVDAATVEIPGGMVDPGEEPAAAAVRELEEETGFTGGTVHLLGWVEPNPAFLTNRCWTYLVRDCVPDGTPRPDPSEEISLRLEPLSMFTGLIDDGTIRHSLVIAAHDHLQRGIRRGADWAGAISD